MNRQLRKNLIFNTAGSLLFYICQASMNLLVTALSGAAANGLLATAMTIANVGLSFGQLRHAHLPGVGSCGASTPTAPILPAALLR